MYALMSEVYQCALVPHNCEFHIFGHSFQHVYPVFMLSRSSISSMSSGSAETILFLPLGYRILMDLSRMVAVRLMDLAALVMGFSNKNSVYEYVDELRCR